MNVRKEETNKGREEGRKGRLRCKHAAGRHGVGLGRVRVTSYRIDAQVFLLW